ncbi:MAG: rod shape-determining protein MreD [Sphingomonas sp.]
MNQRIRGAFDADEPSLLYRTVPALTVMAGSLTAIVPVIAGIGLMPPFGLLMLLAWRLSQSESIAVWAAPLLGLFDDLLSGQPPGCSMLLWSLCFMAFDLVDQRLVWRDFWQDWALAAGAIAFCQILGRLIASPLAAQVDTVLIAQILVSSLLYPLIVRLCAWIERTRDPA